MSSRWKHFVPRIKINLIKVDDKKWEMVGCSCITVKDYLQQESQANDIIKEYFKCKKRKNKILGSFK